MLGVGRSMTEVVGGTPVVRLRQVVPKGAADVLVKLEWFNPTDWFNSEWLVDVASFSLRAASTIPGSATPCGDLGGLGDVIVRGLLVLNIVERWRVRGDLSDGDETFDVELKL